MQIYKHFGDKPVFMHQGIELHRKINLGYEKGSLECLGPMSKF